MPENTRRGLPLLVVAVLFHCKAMLYSSLLCRRSAALCYAMLFLAMLCVTSARSLYVMYSKGDEG